MGTGWRTAPRRAAHDTQIALAGPGLFNERAPLREPESFPVLWTRFGDRDGFRTKRRDYLVDRCLRRHGNRLQRCTQRGVLAATTHMYRESCCVGNGLSP